ncbi:uncharacterized protein LOC124656836 [Lolium rigidum]|uniref:uncharacterized protein LOC124656836 n=1 Tax=Lolium rigidum TaxID=89674 RepID=UPI001F5D6F02|nr:uncharacterized protein LOC124656836 [Lolium rigidum]
MAEGVKTMLTTAIALADQVAVKMGSTKCLPECMELCSRVRKLAAALRLAARTDLYERPAERIIPVAMDALVMAGRCFEGNHSRLRRFLAFNFSLVPTVRHTLEVLDAALADVAWLLRFSSPHTDGDMLGLPNMLRGDPKLFLVWDHIARVRTGSRAVRADSASSLASLARDNPRFAELIVQEDGVRPLVNLLKAGTDDGKEAAATALGLLGHDEESVDKLLRADVCFVYAAALKEPSMRVRAAAAEAIALLAQHNRRLQDSLAQTNAVRLLVSLLDETPETMTSLHSVVLAKMRQGQQIEDAAAKARMKTMAAKALWKLARGHPGVCQSIAESGGILCFTRILDKSDRRSELQFYYSTMMIMEIARVAEVNLALRQCAFKPGKAAGATEQLLRIVREGESDDPLLLPCITSLGCLSRTFTASQISRVVGLLVELLDNREPSVTREAMLALTKFVCTGNHLHVNHSKAIVDAGGAKHLVLLVYLGDKQLQIHALILLCAIALNVPEKEELAQAGVLDVLVWASKQVHLVQDAGVEALRTNAVGTLLD